MESLHGISGGHDDTTSFAIWEVILKIGAVIIGVINN
jgi:hypothetical protein